MNTDLDIAKKANMLEINMVANKLNIDNKYIENYGKYKAKISLDIMKDLEKKDEGKLILVTSTNPTPYG